MALTIEKIQQNITDKRDLREIFNQLADYVQANPPSSPGGSSLQVSDPVTLTHAQILASPSSEYDIVLAVGAGKYAKIMGGTLRANTSGGAYNNLTSGGTFRLTQGSTSIRWQTSNGILAEEADMIAEFSQAESINNASATNLNNSGIKLICDNSDGDFTDGHAGNEMTVTVYYIEVDL